MAKSPLFLVLLTLFSLLVRTVYAAEVRQPASSAAPVNISDEQVKDDTRVRILEAYLKQYNSPLAGSAKTFVEAADENNIDWKLVAAISGVESTFAKQLPHNSYNAWGWGIYGDNIIYFKSYDDGITTISKGLRENYINKLKTDDVYAIGRMYAASPTWASRVEYFMGKIDQFSLDNPSNALSISL